MDEATPRQKIVIIGLGLIGGSIGLALKGANLSNIRVVGHDVDGRAMSKAKKRGAVDDTDSSIVTSVRESSCVVVAVPVMRIRRVFQEIAPHLGENAIVTDTGSSKLEVLKWAADELPESVSFIGGHPMAGKEQTGFAAADPDLFRDKPWVISPSINAPEGAVNAVISVAQALGARPIFMDPDEHDSYVAAVSHLPLTLSSALFSMAFESQAWPELAALASSGFRDTTRLASGSPDMAHDIVQTARLSGEGGAFERGPALDLPKAPELRERREIDHGG